MVDIAGLGYAVGADERVADGAVLADAEDHAGVALSTQRFLLDGVQGGHIRYFSLSYNKQSLKGTKIINPLQPKQRVIDNIILQYITRSTR